MKKIVCWIVMFLFVMNSLGTYGQAEKEQTVFTQELYARSAVLMDGNSGRILFGKNEDEILPMASTTKIMTCILALELGNLEDIVTVSVEAAKQPEVKLGMNKGETYVLRDLLYSLMLESHNDSAVAIAEHIGNTVKDFAALMNQKAKELGCESTHYITPNGLDGSDELGIHGTTARDLARVMTYCVAESPAKDMFREITAAKMWEFQDCKGRKSYVCYNHNSFLDMMEGAFSGKTGFTSAAGYCYVGALESEGRIFVAALLACGWPYNRSYKWEDTKKLMLYGKEHYHNEEIICEIQKNALPVQNGIGIDKNPFLEKNVTIAPEVKEKKTYLVGDMEEIHCQVTIKNKLDAPVKKGTVVGKVRYYLNGIFLEEYDILTQEDIEKKGLKDCFFWMLKDYGF